MKVSATIAMWACLVFALGCLGFAISGFLAIESMVSETERELSRGYAWFWMFLGAVASAFGALSWMIKRGKFGDEFQ
jgi:hypothetical protein